MVSNFRISALCCGTFEKDFTSLWELGLAIVDKSVRPWSRFSSRRKY